MSAETLRKAASLMRERAEAATPGPWHHYETTEHIGQGFCGEEPCNPDQCGTNVAYLGGGQIEPADAEHIASWHPAVALAVADWLDACALVAEAAPSRHKGLALAVARAYLGGDAVVRDDRGKRWSRVKDGFNWRWRDDHFGEQTAWEHLVKRGVRVLSEGVTEGGA